VVGELQDLAVSVAIEEVLHPTWGVTQQVLAVHQIAIRDGQPSILRVDTETEPGTYFIYFEIVDEPYYFVIIVSEKDKILSVSGVYIEAEVKVELSISGTILHPDVITERLKLNPTRKCVLGESIRPQTPNIKFKTHSWYFEPQQDIPGELENKLQFLLTQLDPIQAEIANLQDSCDITICICYNGYQSSMGGWHIDKEILQKIVALGAEVDFDLYAYGKHDLPS
jgi:hypothetical protein